MISTGMGLGSALALLGLASMASAQSSSVSFAYPPKVTPKMEMDVVDTVVVQWESNFKNSWVYLYCDVGTPAKPNWSVWANDTAPQSGTMNYSPKANSNVNRDWSQGYYCHFDLNYIDAAGQGLNGNGFTITSQAGKQASTLSMQPTPTLSKMVASSATGASQMTSGTASIIQDSATTTPTGASASTVGSSPTNTPPSSSSSGMSTGAKAGIAVGSIAAVIAVVGLAILVFRNKRRHQAHETHIHEADSEDFAKPQGVEVAAPPIYKYRHEAPGIVPPAEMGEAKRPVEMAGSEPAVPK